MISYLHLTLVNYFSKHSLIQYLPPFFIHIPIPLLAFSSSSFSCLFFSSLSSPSTSSNPSLCQTVQFTCVLYFPIDPLFSLLCSAPKSSSLFNFVHHCGPQNNTISPPKKTHFEVSNMRQWAHNHKFYWFYHVPMLAWCNNIMAN